MAWPNRKVLLLVLCLAVCVGTCLGDDVVDHVKEKAQDAGEKAESWAGWAFDKVTDGLGIKKDTPKEVTHVLKTQAGYVASDHVGAMKSAALASDYASQKSSQVAGTARKGANKLSDKTADAKETMSTSLLHGKKKAAEAADEATNKVKDAKGQARVKVADIYHKAREPIDNVAGAPGFAGQKSWNAYDEVRQQLDDDYEGSRYGVAASANAKANRAMKVATGMGGDEMDNGGK